MTDSGWTVDVRQASLPPMAWVLVARSPNVRIRHGALVRSFGDSGVFEGSWVGTAGVSGILESTTTFGSGALIADGGLHLVPPSHHLESIYMLRRDGQIMASNSLTGLLVASGLELLPGIDYPSIFGAGDDGTFRFGVPTSGEDVEVLLFDTERVALDGTSALVTKRREGPLGSFSEYRARWAAAFASVAANAPEFEPVCTISSGYDSASMAVLARESGARRAVTITQGKRVKGSASTVDSGARTAATLGFEVTSYDRLAYMSRGDLVEADFLASGATGEDVVFADMGFDIHQTVLVTGFFGDGMWWLNRPHRPLFWRLEQAGHSLPEFRLRTGFIHVPLPWFAANEMYNVGEISNSPEMRPYVLGMDNDRPVPRRILEEAGVPRGTFADAKRATSAAIHTQGINAMSPAARDSLAAFAAAHGERIVFKPRPFAPWRRVVFHRARTLKLRRISKWVEKPRRKAQRQPPEFGNLVLRWAVNVVSPRYSEVANMDVNEG